MARKPPRSDPQEPLPSAYDRLSALLAGGATPAVFLDYDGTLSPIAERPEDAVMSPGMRAGVQRLAGLCPLAVLSGRDLRDVQDRVAVEGIWYAGSHGFDIAGPAGEHMEHPEGVACLPVLDDAERTLRQTLADVPGCQVDRKRFAIAVHFRRVPEARLVEVEAAIDRVRSAHPALRCYAGKKVFELQPDVDWHKGKALHWLMDTLGISGGQVTPLYIGDDTTDEDAFRELPPGGVGILVGDPLRPTAADCSLADPPEVERFLAALADRLQRGNG